MNNDRDLADAHFVIDMLKLNYPSYDTLAELTSSPSAAH
jgi:hypothetical protein